MASVSEKIDDETTLSIKEDQLDQGESEICGKLDMACDTEYIKCSIPKGIDIAKYILQKEQWPNEGKHILAQYDEQTIIVYQAFKPSIAKYAVAHQRFGGPEFSFERMSWIKTNFLWMTYRCGWASKKNQERVLAVKISRIAFETILANAYTVKLQKELNLQTADICVRLQWDPDHSPTYGKLSRRAIQLGLKGEILKKYGTEWISSITDITDFVLAQKKILDRDGQKELMTPKERVYPVRNHNICARIELDLFDREPMFAQRRELAVFDLKDSVEEKHLKEIFSAYGPIDQIRIIHDKQTGKSLGYGFVSFRNIEDASQARASLDETSIAGQKIRVAYAKSLEKAENIKSSISSSGAEMELPQNSKEEGKQLWISGLTQNVDSAHLREIFQNYGSLDEILIICDKKTGQANGHGMVKFKTKEDALKAKEGLNGGQVDGQEVKVGFTDPREKVSEEDISNVRLSSSKQWICQVSGCSNVNISARKRCSRCNTPRIETTATEGTSSISKSGDSSIAEARQNTASTKGLTENEESGFTAPEDLHVPADMIVPETTSQHDLIEKTAKFVASNGIEMENMIKERQGGNPKMRFLNLHDPLNYYYNHMVKMIKSEKYSPK